MKKRISILLIMIMTLEIWVPSALGLETSRSVQAASLTVNVVNPAEPYITSLLPLNGAKGVMPDTAIQIKFNEPVTITSGTITFTDTSAVNPAVPITVDVLDPARVPISSPTQLDINLLPGQLIYNRNYEVSMNAVASIVSTSSPLPEVKWGFRTISSQINTAAPAITQFTPKNGNSGVEPTSAGLQLLFNEEVSLGTGNIHIHQVVGGVEVETISVQSGISAAVTLNPTNHDLVHIQTSKLTPSTAYYVLIDAGTFEDVDGMAFAGILSSTQWGFITKGNPATLTHTLPADGATSIAQKSPIELNFNQNVNLGSGNITIRSAGSATIDASIPVFSTKVVGVGTNKIVVTPDITFQNNKSYTVTVPAGAFLDNGSNPVPQNNISWTFTTIGDQSVLKETAVSPTNGSVAVPLSTDLVLTFNRAVKAANGTDNAIIKLYKTTNSQPTLINVAVNASNPTQVRSVNKVSLDQDSSYYVVVDSGVFIDRVNAGIVYGGLSSSASWNFKTSSSDKVAPVLQSTQMYNATTIKLSYNEGLNYTNSINSSSFAVTVNGESRKVSHVYTSGESVYVVLEIGVSVGQNIKISYTGSSSAIMDTALNAAISFALRDVTNGIDSALPKPREGRAYSNTVTLLFDETLKIPSTNAYEQFTVTADGSSMGVRSIYQSGSSLVLTLNSSVSDGQVIKVSYSPGSYPIQDYRSLNMSAFTDFFVRNQLDSKAPIFMGVEASGSKVILKYNEALHTSNLPMKSQFSVLMNKVPNYVTALVVKDNLVELTLASPITTTQEVTVSYVPGVGSQRITDLNGNSAGYINLESVNLVAGTLVADVKSASIKGDTLTLQFSKNITSSISTSTLNTLFMVRVDSTIRTIQSTMLNGDTITFRISPAATTDQKVQISYNAGSSAIKDLQGNVIPSFSNLNVQNVTNKNDVTMSGLGILDAAEFGNLMYVLPTSAATANESRSKLNQSIRRYLLDSAKLKLAYDEVMTKNTNSKTIVFEVPSYEKAAYVGVPLQTLQDAFTKEKNAQFAVKTGDSIYLLPLSSLNVVDINRSLTSATSLVTIWIQVESAPTSASSDLHAKISQVGGQIIVDSTDFYVSAVNNSTSKSVDLHLKGEYLIRTTKPVPNITTAFVYYDQSIAQISFVPTKIKKLSAYTVLNAKVKGNYMVTGVTGSKYYSDLNKHWAKDSINELLAKYIIDGRTTTLFEPNKNITRGEFAVYIARALGLPSDTESTIRFSDVQRFSATGSYIGAAAKAGIITGYTDGTFKADSYITREQLAIMMVRAMDYAGYKSTASTSTTILTSFKDRGKIQSPVTVAKAVKEGIIKGTTATTFQPQGNATRAQAAVMLKRLLNTIEYL